MFFQLVQALLGEYMIQDVEYGKAIFLFFKIIITDLLPLRLADIDFVAMVIDDIFNNDKSLYTAMKKQVTYCVLSSCQLL